MSEELTMDDCPFTDDFNRVRWAHVMGVDPSPIYHERRQRAFDRIAELERFNGGDAGTGTDGNPQEVS